MNQGERDRLVVLKKAHKQLITQKQAAEELGFGGTSHTAAAG